MTLLDSERTYVMTLSTLLQVIAALQFVTTLMSSVSFSLSFRLVNEKLTNFWHYLSHFDENLLILVVVIVVTVTKKNLFLSNVIYISIFSVNRVCVHCDKTD